jgi:hypothetical protein
MRETPSSSSEFIVASSGRIPSSEFGVQSFESGFTAIFTIVILSDPVKACPGTGRRSEESWGGLTPMQGIGFGVPGSKSGFAVIMAVVVLKISTKQVFNY